MAESHFTNIQVSIDAIRSFCQRWNIAEFALFGSVLRPDFSIESDIDVLVSFREDTRYSLTDWIDMGDELETLFGRKVDLIDRKAIETSRNYLRRKIILDSAQVIYAA
ncbi:MAG: nucleotidyltransferase family protein [Anaerolineaceae bacterium]|nr:nucleotidyltransferase family protein [Anaerolineaceae bacterium]